ncbi:MAG TPA: hypothetical protein VHG70_15715 [Nocardioidaceae bacterium]|nr:hypothetical protein [Nocardioidaceae bacterium]
MSDGAPATPVAVVDIDGVLADVRHRLHHVSGRRRDWEAFFAAAPDDALLDEGVAVAERLAQEHDLVYLSGRPERCRDDTLAWLELHDLPPGDLLLRPEGDRRPARAFKLDRLRELAADRGVAVLVDDDPAVCEAARRRGFVVFEATWMAQQPTLFEAQEHEGRT